MRPCTHSPQILSADHLPKTHQIHKIASSDLTNNSAPRPLACCLFKLDFPFHFHLRIMVYHLASSFAFRQALCIIIGTRKHSLELSHSTYQSYLNSYTRQGEESLLVLKKQWGVEFCFVIQWFMCWWNSSIEGESWRDQEKLLVSRNGKVNKEEALSKSLLVLN